MKRCVTCDQSKPCEDFAVRRASADGLQSRCRQCYKDWYVSNGARARAAVAGRTTRVQAALRKRLAAHLAEHPCVECGETDIRVLDFDHRDGVDKRADIARMIGASMSWSTIEAEIDKCDVRCSNCHRRRTAATRGWWRQEVFEVQQALAVAASEARLASILPGR